MCTLIQKTQQFMFTRIKYNRTPSAHEASLKIMIATNVAGSLLLAMVFQWMRYDTMDELMDNWFSFFSHLGRFLLISFISGLLLYYPFYLGVKEYHTLFSGNNYLDRINKVKRLTNIFYLAGSVLICTKLTYEEDKYTTLLGGAFLGIMCFLFYGLAIDYVAIRWAYGKPIVSDPFDDAEGPIDEGA
jgi:hypothetical protein